MLLKAKCQILLLINIRIFAKHQRKGMRGDFRIQKVSLFSFN